MIIPQEIATKKISNKIIKTIKNNYKTKKMIKRRDK
jgi:hypothetical protein